MTVTELIAELAKYPGDTEVHMTLGYNYEVAAWTAPKVHDTELMMVLDDEHLGVARIIPYDPSDPDLDDEPGCKPAVIIRPAN
jgi:hypothetical protein